MNWNYIEMMNLKLNSNIQIKNFIEVSKFKRNQIKKKSD